MSSSSKLLKEFIQSLILSELANDRSFAKGLGTLAVDQQNKWIDYQDNNPLADENETGIVNKARSRENPRMRRSSV